MRPLQVALLDKIGFQHVLDTDRLDVKHRQSGIGNDRYICVLDIDSDSGGHGAKFGQIFNYVIWFFQQVVCKRWFLC